MAKTKTMTSSEELRDVVCESILEKKGEQIAILDLREIYNSIADFFIICHGNNPLHMQSIADEIRKSCREKLGEKFFSIEGQKDSSDWILIDYFDVVVHIFSEEARNRFNLESVWGDAKLTKLDDFGKLIND